MPTATARDSTRAAAAPAAGCSGSPATQRSTSFGGARRQTALAEEPIDLAGIDAEHPVEQSERRLAVAGALEGLEARERELVALKFFAGLDNVEIAVLLEISESNVGTRLHRVVTKLREACDGAP